MNKSTKTSKNKIKKTPKLPKYLTLAKGSMWFDTEGENASGVRLFASKNILTSREYKDEQTITNTGETVKRVRTTDIPKDKYDNENYINYGKVDNDLDWYIDTSKIDNKKLSRIITAYNNGILKKADPNNPPGKVKIEGDSNFKYNKNGDLQFIGKNESMYNKLQNNGFNTIRQFINSSPNTLESRNNLIDLYDYELKGYNKLSRPRGEVLDLIKSRLNSFGCGISPMRLNEQDK